MSALSSRRRWWESGQGLSEQEREWTRKRARERERERRSEGNRSKQGTSPPDANWCRDRPNPPLTWTHTLTLLRGPEPEEERHNRELGSEVRGRTDGSLSFLSVAWDDKKNKINCLDQRTNYKDDWTLTGRLMARRTGRRDERITSRRHTKSRKKWLICRSLKKICEWT